jgi:predicted transcriptional regulator
MSIHPQHVVNIVSGEKTVEIRRRRVAFPSGTQVWIYSTLPVGAIQASVDVLSVDLAPPSIIWKKYHAEMCISRHEFNLYTNGTDFVSAITISNVRLLPNGLSLEHLRNKLGSFSPPQSYYYLTENSGIQNLLSNTGPLMVAGVTTGTRNRKG